MHAFALAEELAGLPPSLPHPYAVVIPAIYDWSQGRRLPIGTGRDAVRIRPKEARKEPSTKGGRNTFQSSRLVIAKEICPIIGDSRALWHVSWL